MNYKMTSNVRYCHSCKHYKHDNPKHPYGWGLCALEFAAANLYGKTIFLNYDQIPPF